MFLANSRVLPLALTSAILVLVAWDSAAFVPITSTSSSRDYSTALSDDAWAGEVVSNDPTGKIRGCQVQSVGGSPTDWEISIDGDQADLGKFSEAIYKKITQDAKQQRYVTDVVGVLASSLNSLRTRLLRSFWLTFAICVQYSRMYCVFSDCCRLLTQIRLSLLCSFQGFRPGTIPPHLTPTYIAFAMDECAREATLEAMEQNNIRPFENARADFAFESISIPPPKKKAKKKKKKSKEKKGKGTADTAATASIAAPSKPPAEEIPVWLKFETMKEGELVSYW